MRHRFILHSLSHTFVAVDISKIGLPNEIYPPTGKQYGRYYRRVDKTMFY